MRLGTLTQDWWSRRFTKCVTSAASPRDGGLSAIGQGHDRPRRQHALHARVTLRWSVAPERNSGPLRAWGGKEDPWPVVSLFDFAASANVPVGGSSVTANFRQIRHRPIGQGTICRFPGYSAVRGVISRLRASDRAIWSVLALLAMGPLFLGIVALAEQLH